MKELLTWFLKSEGVSTDTRTVKRGQLFFALKGDHFDGNQYALKAIEQGALLAVVDDPNLKGNPFCYWVDDVLTALQKLALEYRQTFTFPLIALTGSNGKTTTKELLHSVFSQFGAAYATKGNFNNHIGLPLTLLSFPPSAAFAIVEMGANHIGEIDMLTSIARPDFGLITNIGMAHIEGFGSREGIALGKFELFNYLIQCDKPLLYRSNDFKLGSLIGDYPNTLCLHKDEVWIHGVPCVFHCMQTEPFIKGHFNWKARDYELNSSLFGTHNLQNIMMAVTTALFYHVPPDRISQGISLYRSTNNRSELREWKGAKLYLDAYNANPDSMKASINSFFAQTTIDKSFLILGEMKELGNLSISEHQNLLFELEELGFKNVWLLGSEWAKSSLPIGYLWFESFDSLALAIDQKDWSSLDIFVKGSRSNHLERLFT